MGKLTDVYKSTNQSDGNECSSTYEGRHLSIKGDELRSAGTVAGTGIAKGEAVAFGDIGVGISFKSIAQADLANERAAIDTEGVWWKTVTLTNTRVAGDAVYFNDADGTLQDTGGGGTRFFGYLVTGGDAGDVLCAVKVHFCVV